MKSAVWLDDDFGFVRRSWLTRWVKEVDRLTRWVKEVDRLTRWVKEVDRPLRVRRETPNLPCIRKA